MNKFWDHMRSASKSRADGNDIPSPVITLITAVISLLLGNTKIDPDISHQQKIIYLVGILRSRISVRL